MRSRHTIEVTQPHMPPLEEYVALLRQVWDAKWLTNNGAMHRRLEGELCEFLGVEHVSLVANGTLGLCLALRAAGVVEGEVITTPFSFVATTHAISWNGLTPVFCDIREDTLNLDERKLESLITPRTSAILPVHVYGTPCATEKIQAIAERHGIPVIYDAAHAFGVRSSGRPLVDFGDFGVLSFHATKVFSTAEGGAIICHDAATKRKIDSLKNFGIEDEVTVSAVGINGKMNELQAAMGLAQLCHMAEATAGRRRIAERYRESLARVSGLQFSTPRPGVTENFAYFPILIDNCLFGVTRDGVHEYLRAHGVKARRYFYPLISDFPMYLGHPSSQADQLPVAKWAAERILCLPIHPGMGMEDVVRVVDSVLANRNEA